MSRLPALPGLDRFSRLRLPFLRGAFLPVLLEAAILAFCMLLLVFSVIQELPAINIPSSFFFLIQIPVGWAALRLKPSPNPRARLRIRRELAFAAALRAVLFLLVWLMAGYYQAWDLLHGPNFTPVLDLLLQTAAFLPFLLYRAILLALTAWQRLTGRSFLWMMVNTHLVTVFTLVVLVSLIASLQAFGQSYDAYEPSGLLARLVLDFVRSIVPWVGIGVAFLVISMAVIFLPTLAVSYLTSLRFVSRLHRLAGAMQKLRQGDLSARVAPSGNDEIARLQDDFNHMAGELQAGRDKIAGLLQNQRELSAVVSHELRTPLAVMRAHIENDLFETPLDLPEPYRQHLHTLHHETLKLQSLVEDLFTLSQLDQQRFSLDCRPVSAAAVIENVVSALQRVAWENRRVDLSAQLPSPPPTLWADPTRLEQVLSNLVQNAIRHSIPGGVILLEVQTAGDWVEIHVIDSGEGIAPADLPHIWERFYRGAQGQGAGRTGIGLSLVKELVEMMGGSATVDSRPGEGSRFVLRLRASLPGPLSWPKEHRPGEREF